MMNLRARAYADEGYSARRISEMCGITMKDARRIKAGRVTPAPVEPEVDLPPIRALRQYRMLDIMATVAKVFHVKVRDLQRDVRAAEVVNARQAVMWIARESGWSYIFIGTAMGRNHSTIIHGVRTAERRMAQFATYRERVHAAVGIIERNEVQTLSTLACVEVVSREPHAEPEEKPVVSLKRVQPAPKPTKVRQPVELAKPNQAHREKQTPKIEPPPPAPAMIRDFAIGQEQREREHLESLKQPPPMCSDAWWKWNDLRFRKGMRAAGYHENLSAMRGAA